MWQSATPQQGRKIDWKEAGERKATFVAARDELATTWLAEEEAHPVLAAFRRDAQREKGDLVSAFAKLDLGELGSSDVDKEIATLLSRVLPTLAHIGRAKELISKRLISPLTLPSVVALTQANMFIPAGSIRAGVVRDRVQAARDDRESWLVSALSLALALVTLVPTGGTSLAMVGVASATLATYSTLRELEQFELHKVLADTDLDRARALMQGDPSPARFVTSLLALGLEGLPLLHAITCRQAVARGGAVGDDTSRLVRQINDVTGEAKLGEQALADAQAAERRAARAGGEQPPKAPHEPTVRVPGPGAQLIAGPGAVHGLSGPARGRRRDAERAARPDRRRHAPADPLCGWPWPTCPRTGTSSSGRSRRRRPPTPAREVQELPRSSRRRCAIPTSTPRRSRTPGACPQDTRLDPRMRSSRWRRRPGAGQGHQARQDVQAQKFYEAVWRGGGVPGSTIRCILADHGALDPPRAGPCGRPRAAAGGQAAHGTGIPRPARPAAWQGDPGGVPDERGDDVSRQERVRACGRAVAQRRGLRLEA